MATGKRKACLSVAQEVLFLSLMQRRVQKFGTDPRLERSPWSIRAVSKSSNKRAYPKMRVQIEGLYLCRRSPNVAPSSTPRGLFLRSRDRPRGRGAFLFGVSAKTDELMIRRSG